MNYHTLHLWLTQLQIMNKNNSFRFVKNIFGSETVLWLQGIIVEGIWVSGQNLFLWA